MGDTDLLAPTVESEVVIIEFSGKSLPTTYVGLIYSKWLRSLRHGNEFFKTIDPKSYYEIYHAYLTRILASDNCLVRLAVLSDEHDVVLGFCVSRGTVLDYVHVLRIRLKVETGFDITDYRKMGIGTKLIPKACDTFTHITKAWQQIWPKKFGHLKFNPFV